MELNPGPDMLKKISIAVRNLYSLILRMSTSTVFLRNPSGSDKGPDTRNGGICLYFKESLAIKERSDLEIISGTVVAEVKLIRKTKSLLFFRTVIQTFHTI